MSQVFISYPRDQAAGQKLARELNGLLRRQQITTFFDEEGIAFGERWLSALKQGVERCRIMLWVVSSASHDREWQEREFNEAKRCQLTVIPVLAEDVPLPMQVNDVQAAFLFGERKAAQLDSLLHYLEQHLGIDRLKPLIKAALKARQNEAYEQAMTSWQQVLALDPGHARAQAELESLEQLRQQREQGQACLGQLVLRMNDIAPVFAEAAQLLNAVGKHPNAAAVLMQTQALLVNDLSAADYVQWFRTLAGHPARIVGVNNPTNYAAFAQRVVRGEIVLFIGSGLAQEYRIPVQDEQALAQQLAGQAKLPDFRGSLSGIAEYYRLSKDYGEERLLEALRDSLDFAGQEPHLYPLLAQVQEPLILVSSAYDDALERCFDAAQKPYVELTSLVNRCDGHDIGHLVVRYSDREQPEVYQPIEEEISRFRWYEEGYSLIFKMRGTCGQRPEHEYQRDALTLTESDYFTFAKYAEKMIPAYLAKHFKKKGFLFVGFSPKSWEERLLVNALLERRRTVNSKYPAYTVGVAHDPLEAAYWMGQQVQQHDMDMHKLGEYLEEALL